MPNPIFAATVIFSGLILHVDMNSTTHQKNAYLIDATNHQSPHIVVKTGDVSSVSGIPGTTSGGTTTFEFRKAAKQYIIVAGSGTKVTELADFQNHVPHLKKIIDVIAADLHANVKAGKNHLSHVTFTYTNGDLGITHCFDEAIQFNPHDMREQCLAEQVRLTIPTTANWEIREVGNPSNKIVLLPGATVLIENAAPLASTSAHQTHYAMMLDRSAKVDKIVRTSSKCNVNTCAVVTTAEAAKNRRVPRRPPPASQATPRVECSNTQWP